MDGKQGCKMGKWGGDGMGQGERVRSGKDVNFAQSNQSFPHRPPQTPTKNIYPPSQKRAPKNQCLSWRVKEAFVYLSL